MRILIPVDETDRYKSSLDFIGHLGCADLRVRFLHVVAPVSSYDGSFMALTSVNGPDLTSLQEEVAEKRLRSICYGVQVNGLAATWKVEFGYPAEEIAKSAQEYGADLVAVAAIPKQPVERFLLGSVALTLAKDYSGDLLIVRSDQTCPKACSLVYATDRLDPSKGCLDRLLSWHMKGISRAEVLTATDQVGAQNDDTEEIAKRFTAEGIEACAELLALPINEAIDETMGRTGSNLLVLASIGHGFWQNLTEGSTTLHEVASEPYSILILRPDLCAPHEEAPISNEAVLI